MFCSACADYSFVIAWKGKLTDRSMRLYQGLPSKARPLWDQKVIDIGSGKDVPQRSPYRPRNNGVRNASSFLGNDEHGGSSSSLDTIRPPERSPYWRDGLHNSASNDSHVWGSSSSLNTIRPINHENPQLLPYPSSTTLQSNGSVYNASFMTSPSYGSLVDSEVLNDIAGVCLSRHDCLL